MYNRDSKIMRKLLGKTAPETAAGEPPIPSTAPSTRPNTAANYRPSKSQNAVYAAGVPISCLDVSPDRRLVALAGPHILKTIVQDDAMSFDFSFSEGFDVRATITASSAAKASAASDQLNIRDVKWHGNSMIFTACANGRIFAYDVARIGTGGSSEAIDYIHMQEDSRQVNTLDVNPHLKSWLLSGSQDGLVRIFDTANAIHTRSGFLTFRQRFAALRCNDSIRQVKWSPRVGHEMACCTDSGIILKWDVRQPSRPLLRISAHDKACTAISWHPDGLHLISAGTDSKLHVWDMGNAADRRQKPKYSVSTPAPVKTVAWRPGLWSASAQSRRVAQVAVTYDETSKRRYGTSVVHIWDLARPTMPYKEIERFDSSPSALLWQDQDMLWTIGRDGMFNQCDVAYAPRMIDRQSTSAMAFSSRGDVLMFLDERPQYPRPRPVLTKTETSPAVQHSSYGGSSPRAPVLSYSKSDSEEDVLGSFLGPRRRHKRRPSGRNIASMSTTPPGASNFDEAKQNLGLDQAIQVTGMFKTQQAMSSGHIPAAKSVQVYKYLSSVYLETLEKDLPYVEGMPMVERVTAILQRYARASEHVSLFRLSQTWRVLAFAVSLLLNRRAQYHLETRLARAQKLKMERKATIDDTPRRPSVKVTSPDGRYLGGSLLSDDIDTSNMATPVARPADRVADQQDHAYRYGARLPPIAEPDSFTIGPSVTIPFHSSPRKRLDSVPISVTSEGSGHSQASNTEGYDFYDTEALSHAIDMPSPRDPNNWAHGDQTPEPRRGRQGSDNSDMFSVSEGPHSKSPGTNGFTRPKLVKQVSSRSSWTNSYESRIRGGDGMRFTGELTSKSASGGLDHSPEDGFMVSQATTTDGSYVSQSFLSNDPNSGRQPAQSPPISHPFDPYSDPNPQIVENDYLPWPNDPPYPHPLTTKSQAAMPPMDPHTLLTRALTFESQTSALNAAAIILLLKPLVPDNVIDTHHATAILRQHHTRLMAMSLFVEAALLRNLCVAGWTAGWTANYTAIFSPAQSDVKSALSCPSCHKPRELDPKNRDTAIWKCDRCTEVMAPCAVCGHREPEMAASIPVASDKNSALWWYCPTCAHGGHASCLQSWHADSHRYSSGCCPLDGCGHACLPGPYRSETATARADDVGRQAMRSVPGSRRQSPRGDRDEIPQSRAVGVAREVLGKGTGILSSSPGRTGERERRKSVKFARTDR